MQDSKMLPFNFYDSKAWQGTILDYYTVNPKFHGRDVLAGYVAKLTESVAITITVCGNFPDNTSSLLRQTTDPLFDRGEYESKVYNVLKAEAEESFEPELAMVADSLILIRQFFLKDKIVLGLHFQKEIDLVKEASPELRFLRFSESIKTITNTHIQQITHMIDEGNY